MATLYTKNRARSQPRAKGAPATRHRSPALGLHAALSASLALLDKPNVPSSLSYRIRWGCEDGRTVIVKETPRSLELQADRWRDVTATVAALGEAASAVRDWRETHELTHGSVGLAVIADRLASLVPSLREHVETVVDLSPTLRASVRRLERRQARIGGAA